MSTKPAVEMQAPPKAKGLFAKLCEAGAAIGWVEKSGRNEFHKYNYATEADLVSKLRGELYSRGVFCYPTTLTVERKPVTVETYKGARTTAITDIMVRWTFVDADSGETFSMDLPGSGEDSGDKGVYKALTGSEKYMLMKSFLIPTGDDPENDKDEPNTPANKPPIQQPTRTSARGPMAPPPAVMPAANTNAMGQPMYRPKARPPFDRDEPLPGEEPPPPDQPIAPPVKTISRAQIGKLWAVARQNGWNEDHMKILLSTHKLARTQDIPAKDFDGILAEVSKAQMQ